MAKKRASPTREEIERIVEAIDSLDSFDKIQDRDSFDLIFDDYFEGDETMLSNEKARNEIFGKLQDKHPVRISDERLFKKARGKSLKHDRGKTARRVLSSKEEYIKKGARRVDLKGYDTKIKKIRKKRELNIVGKVKGKVVYSSKEIIRTNKGKEVVRHRDKLGRFVSIKR